jgi:hypothetical protein
MDLFTLFVIITTFVGLVLFTYWLFTSKDYDA